VAVVRSPLVACLLALTVAALTSLDAEARSPSPTRVWQISYRAWDGRSRRAFVVLPAWYGPRDDPRIPLVISPHGRGVPARDNVDFWGDLPAAGRFAVVNPQGQGRRLTLYSWGDPGEISDLARMPAIVRHALPWLRIDMQRIYAIGGSMGGQETLLLVARDPHQLAGAISFDADTDMALRYRDFGLVPAERHLRRLARLEIGGTPETAIAAFRHRSPLDQARAIASSDVPLEIWWSTKDRVVLDQEGNSEALFDRILALDPHAPVVGIVGTWKHTAEMWYFRRLPSALASIGLLPARDAHPFPRLGLTEVAAGRVSAAPSDRMSAVQPARAPVGRRRPAARGRASTYDLAARSRSPSPPVPHPRRRR
jgi:poly(3-hydroxybutyrate) depolymerase